MITLLPGTHNHNQPSLSAKQGKRTHWPWKQAKPSNCWPTKFTLIDKVQQTFHCKFYKAGDEQTLTYSSRNTQNWCIHEKQNKMQPKMFSFKNPSPLAVAPVSCSFQTDPLKSQQITSKRTNSNQESLNRKVWGEGVAPPLFVRRAFLDLNPFRLSKKKIINSIV